MFSLILEFLDVLLSFLSVFFCLISELTDYWYEEKQFNNTTVHRGIWRNCIEAVDISECNAYEPSGALGVKIEVIQAFTIMAIITLLFTAVWLIVLFRTRILLSTHILLPFSAAICQMIALTIFTVEFKDAEDNDNINFGWSYTLAWLGFSCACANMIIGILLKIIRNDE